MNNNINEEIILNAQKGDKQALNEIIKNIQPQIYGMLYYLKKNNIENNDIAQTILMKVTSKINQLKNLSMFKTWLNQIIVNTYYDYLRANKKHNTNMQFESIKDDAITQLPDYESNPQNSILNNELDLIIKTSIQNLPIHYKIPITLREIQGLSYDEISKIEKVSIGTIKSRISRAREIIKKEINKYKDN